MENYQLIIHDIVRKIDQPIIKQEQAVSISATNDIDAIRTWLQEFVNSPNTAISYRQTAERFIMWLYIQEKTLKDVTREIVQEYQIFLQMPIPNDLWCGSAKPRYHPEWKPFVKGLAQSSINLNLQILGSMFQYLIEAGYLQRNPFRLIRERKKVKTEVERFLNTREWNYINEYIERMPQETEKQQIDYERTKWIFSLLYLTGCRRSEVVNARMADFVYKRHEWWFKVVGKGDKHGEIPVTNELLSALMRYRKAMKLPEYPTSTETELAVIFSKYGNLQPITDSMLYKIIKTVCGNLALELKSTDPASSFVIGKVSTHWLRHTSATHQVDAGIDIRTVKKNLRHSMLETTMKYQHTEESAQHKETLAKFGLKKSD